MANTKTGGLKGDRVRPQPIRPLEKKIKNTNTVWAQATSSQAPGLSRQARKLRVQASSQSFQAPVSQSRGTSEPSPCPGNKQQG